MLKRSSLEAIATLVGFIIGAGVLGIPYVVAKAGFITGIIDIIAIGLAVLFLNLYAGEIILRTKEQHQLAGYAEKYLGKYGKRLMILGMVFGLYGALIAYTMKEGEFLNAILSPIFGGNSLVFSLIFFTVFSFFIFKGIKAVEKSELLMVFFVLAAIFIILAFSLPFIRPENLSGFDAGSFFVPYGVVLFSFLGISAIPELREELKNNKREIKKAIIIGSLIPIAVYLLFAFIVVGVSGAGTTDGAILGLASVIGHKTFLLGILFGFLTMATSFMAVGLALKEMYSFDFGFSDKRSSFLVCFVPLIAVLALSLTGIKNPFFNVLDITGAFAGSLSCILVVLMINKAKKEGNRKPEYSIRENKLIDIALILIFLAGAIYEAFRVLGLML